ncbi:unnamed protein product [Bemisia tabaci]|uniref:SH3 domain-containing protein n=2 Tax=Bemisia tabaci TaxID=7038 RepID=A0A9P0CBF4_BEMTA|nr:unnamed protein product [Bemisia tabaci]
MVEAIAQFDYTPQEPDELLLQKGDVIGDIVFKSEGWWEGTLLKNKQRGMFPDNFVKVMDEETSSKEAQSKKKSVRLCKVRFSYTPANSDELELKVDDIIQILGEVEEGWWSGQLNNKIGVFPSNFVEEIMNLEPVPTEKHLAKEKTPEPPIADKSPESHSSSIIVGPKTEPDAPSLPPKPVKEQYQALFPWDAQNDDELTLKKGDIITLVTKEVADKGWWKGELNGKIGVFPDNFVTPYVVPEPKSLTTTKTPLNQKDPQLKLAVSPNQIANVRKSLDNSPKAESQSSPPIVSKKPQLPPPPPPALKKPQSSPSAPNSSSSPSGSLSKQNSGTSLKMSLSAAGSPPQSPTKKEREAPATGLVRGSRLSASVSASSVTSPESKVVSSPKDHSESLNSELAKESVDGCLPSKLTSGSYNVTNPPTTPPATSPNTSSNQTNSELTRSNETNGVDTDLDVVSRDGSLYHPTLFRAKAPRKRPPSTIILKEDFTLPEELTNGNGTTNNETNVEVTETSPHQANKPPWVEELKMNQAKKNLLQGRTRVIIGPSQTTCSSNETGTIMTSTTIISSSSVPTTVPAMEQTTTITSGKSGFVTTGVGVTFRPNTSVQRPVSMQALPNDSVSVSLKEWNELYSKIDRLELALINQQESFSKEISSLQKQLSEEVGHRKKMRQEIDKLIDLMTQV